jgi:hypothetical protein
MFLIENYKYFFILLLINTILYKLFYNKCKITKFLILNLITHIQLLDLNLEIFMLEELNLWLKTEGLINHNLLSLKIYKVNLDLFDFKIFIYITFKYWILIYP